MGASAAPLNALYKAPRPGYPTVIVVHGLFDSKFSRYVEVAAESLASSGLGVLVPDMRWHGCLLSKEWLPTFGIEEGRDLLAWANWLRATKGTESIGLLGFSLGGLDVLAAATLPEARTMLPAGVIAVCPPGSLKQTFVSLAAPNFFSDRGWTIWIRDAFASYLRARIHNLTIPIAGTSSYAEFLEWLARSLGRPKRLQEQRSWRSRNRQVGFSRLRSPP